MVHHCTVYTDNNPLSHLQNSKLGAIGQRWATQLAAFDLELKYCPGCTNGNADALSRQYEDKSGMEPIEGIASGTKMPVEVCQIALEDLDSLQGQREVRQANIKALPSIQGQT